MWKVLTLVTYLAAVLATVEATLPSALLGPVAGPWGLVWGRPGEGGSWRLLRRRSLHIGAAPWPVTQRGGQNLGLFSILTKEQHICREATRGRKRGLGFEGQPTWEGTYLREIRSLQSDWPADPSQAWLLSRGHGSPPGARGPAPALLRSVCCQVSKALGRLRSAPVDSNLPPVQSHP